MPTFEEMTAGDSFTGGSFTAGGGGTKVTFLPEPESRDRLYTLISVDDHIVEPKNMFEGRMPSEFVEAAPRGIALDNGMEVWAYDGQHIPNVGFNAVVGR